MSDARRKRLSAVRGNQAHGESVLDIDILLSLRPKVRTAEAISRSIVAAMNKHVQTSAVLCQLEAGRGAVLLTGTVKDVSEHEQALRNTRIMIEQLDAFISSMQQPLADAEKAERIANLRSQYAALGYEAKVAAFAAAWRTEYPPAARAVARVLQLEADALAVYQAAKSLSSDLRAEGVDMSTPSTPALAVADGLTMKSFGSVVRLPGETGGPCIRLNTTPREVRRMVQVRDYDTPGPKDETGKPLRFVWKELIEMVTDVRPLRHDPAFWWDGVVTLPAPTGEAPGESDDLAA